MKRKFWVWLFNLSSSMLFDKSAARPTVAELEAILEEETTQLVVLPNGEVRAV